MFIDDYGTWIKIMRTCSAGRTETSYFVIEDFNTIPESVLEFRKPNIISVTLSHFGQNMLMISSPANPRVEDQPFAYVRMPAIKGGYGSKTYPLTDKPDTLLFDTIFAEMRKQDADWYLTLLGLFPCLRPPDYLNIIATADGLFSDVVMT
jgi:hypothetical protein